MDGRLRWDGRGQRSRCGALNAPTPAGLPAWLPADATTLLVLVVGVLLLVMVPLWWFVFRELRSTAGLFDALTARLGGERSTVPIGMRGELDGIRIRVFALAGKVEYRARIRLRSDPGILVTRTFGRFRFVDALHASPGRRKFVFRHPVDEQYGFRAKNTQWMRELFDAEMLDDLTHLGRVARIEVGRAGVKGSLMMLGHSDAERVKANESVDLLTRLTRNLARSSLAKP